MEENRLYLVDIENYKEIEPGDYVKPKEYTGLEFLVGVVIRSDKTFTQIETVGGNITCLTIKLQVIDFYIVSKSLLNVGDTYYNEKCKQGKKEVPARIGIVKKQMDANLFNVGNSKKVIYWPKNIGLTRATNSNLTQELGGIMEINGVTLSAIVANNGLCQIESELINDKVIIHVQKEN